MPEFPLGLPTDTRIERQRADATMPVSACWSSGGIKASAPATIDGERVVVI
jgi:hypothetical protein